MTISNHIVTGALIAAAWPEPAVALPLAFTSHFVLDILPHYGERGSHLSRSFNVILISDMAISVVLMLTFAASGLPDWPLLVGAGILAASPDLLWIKPYLHERKTGEWQLKSRLTKFLFNIQWGERPWGWKIELAWFLAAGTALLLVI